MKTRNLLLNTALQEINTALEKTTPEQSDILIDEIK